MICFIERSPGFKFTQTDRIETILSKRAEMSTPYRSSLEW